MTRTPPSAKDRPPGSPRLLGWYGTLIAMVLAMVFLMLFAYQTGHRMVNLQTPLVDAAVRIQLETLSGHLLFEEVLNGEREGSLEPVWDHYKEALWYADAMLEGGVSPAGVLMPLEDPSLRQQIVCLRESFAQLREVSERRRAARLAGADTAEVDDWYHRIFEEVMHAAGNVQGSLGAALHRELEAFQATHLVLLLVGMGGAVVVGFLFVAFERRARRQILELDAARRRATDSEARFRGLLDHVSDPVYVCDDQGTLVDVNPRALEVLGYTRDELLGRPASEVEVGYTPEQMAEMRGRLVPGVPLRREGLHRRKDGTVFPVEVNLARFDWAGTPVTLGVARDISDRKRAEEALRESEQWYQTLTAVSPVGIFRTDAAGACVYVNERWTRMAGFSAEEARGDGWARAIHPEDRERVVAGWAGAAREGKRFEMEYRFLSPQGVTTWVLGSARAVKGRDGEVVGYVGTVTDITERKRAEEEVRAARDGLEERVAERTGELEEANENLRREVKERVRYEEALRYSEEKYSTLVENSPTGVFIFREGKFVFANPQVAAMGGYSREEFLAMDPFDLIHPEDREWVRDMARRRLAGDVVPTDYEVRVLTRAGETRWVNVRNALITYRGGPSTLATVQDVTERKRMEEALARTGNELRRLSAQILSAQEEERARIARDLHDSIGQALSAIKFHVESAVPTCERLAGEAEMQTLRAAVVRVQQTIEDVRRISMDLRPSILDDLGLVTTLGWLCREFSTRNAGIEVVRRVEATEADVPEHLRIVIFRIVQEALQNVAKHSGADRVELGLRRTGDDLELWVRDSGRGFDPGAVAHRVGAARGFGLGSMRERAQASGGGLEVLFPPDGGTMIRVRWALAGDRGPRANG